MTLALELSTSGMAWSHSSYHLDWNSFLQNCRPGNATLPLDSGQGA